MAPDDAARGLDGLVVDGLVVRAGAAPIDELIRTGDILGVAGLDGHGQEAFLETLAGLRAPVSGRVAISSGSTQTTIAGFKHAVRHGIAYLARDRRTQGIFPALSILDNFGLVSFAQDMRLCLISRASLRARFAQWRERLEIVARDPAAPITTLSGGNQQKVLLARWLALNPRVLLLNDPTRGVDQRTREVLYRAFAELARSERMALVILSTEIEEVLRVCDRVLVFREGEVSAKLDRSAMSQDSVIAAMFGKTA
jgi:ABC-type sugar transport system ATPase subunit